MAPIPEGNPTINISNWSKLCEEGWRWARNVNEGKSDGIISSYQNDYGAACVTLGNAWDEAWRAPVGQDGKQGLYVKDVERRVEALRDDLRTWEKEGLG